MKIYFARHGETDWNIARRIQGTTDIPLNQTGLEQAKRLARNLSENKANLYKVYSSKQARAYETAKIVGDYFDVPVEKIDGLEEMNLGVWEGHTWKEVEEQYPEELQNWLNNRRYGRTPNGESYQDVLERLFHALDSILEESIHENEEEKDILILTHGAVLLTLLALEENVAFEVMTSVIEIENAKAIELDIDEIKKIKGKL